MMSGPATSSVAARRGRPSPAQSRLRQQAVIAAARTEFIENGYRAATMGAIAARAGVSKRSLYLWHADKAALFRACAINGVAGLDLPLLTGVTGLEEGLALFAAALLSALSGDYAFGMGSLLMREGNEFPEIPGAIEQGHILILRPLIDFLERHGVAPAESPRLAHLLEAMLVSDLHYRMVLGLPAPTAAASATLARDVLRLFLHGVAAWQVPGHPGGGAAGALRDGG